MGHQVLSLRKGVGHPIFKPLEGWVMIVFDWAKLNTILILDVFRMEYDTVLI